MSRRVPHAPLSPSSTAPDRTANRPCSSPSPKPFARPDGWPFAAISPIGSSAGPDRRSATPRATAKAFAGRLKSFVLSRRECRCASPGIPTAAGNVRCLLQKSLLPKTPPPPMPSCCSLILCTLPKSPPNRAPGISRNCVRPRSSFTALAIPAEASPNLKPRCA